MDHSRDLAGDSTVGDQERPLLEGKPETAAGAAKEAPLGERLPGVSDPRGNLTEGVS